GPLSLPPIQCDSLLVNDARLVQGSDPRAVGTLQLRDLRHENVEVAGLLEIGRARSVPDSVRLRLSERTLRGRLIEEFTVVSLRVSSAGLAGRLDATLRTDPSGASRVSLEGLLRIDEVEPLAIVPLRRSGLPFGKEDRVAGSILFGGEIEPREEPHGDLVLGLSGRAFDVELDTLRILADATPLRAELVDFSLRAGRLELHGEGVWSIEEKSLVGAAEFSELDLAAP